MTLKMKVIIDEEKYQYTLKDDMPPDLEMELRMIEQITTSIKFNMIKKLLEQKGILC
jgi:hypothetical protein